MRCRYPCTRMPCLLLLLLLFLCLCDPCLLPAGISIKSQASKQKKHPKAKLSPPLDPPLCPNSTRLVTVSVGGQIIYNNDNNNNDRAVAAPDRLESLLPVCLPCRPSDRVRSRSRHEKVFMILVVVLILVPRRTGYPLPTSNCPVNVLSCASPVGCMYFSIHRYRDGKAVLVVHSRRSH
jgi:hypothetical protein